MQNKEIDTSTVEVQAATTQEDQKYMVLNESVAQQIIRQFIDELGKEDGYADVAKRLEAVVFTDKPTEAALKTALFGEVEL